MLKQEADAAAKRAQVGFPDQVDSLVVEPDFTSIRLEKTDEMFEHHALATPAGAHDHCCGGSLELEIQASKDLVGPEGLLEALNTHDCIR